MDLDALEFRDAISHGRCLPPEDGKVTVSRAVGSHLPFRVHARGGDEHLTMRCLFVISLKEGK